jgi:hypothetical protein
MERRSDLLHGFRISVWAKWMPGLGMGAVIVEAKMAAKRKSTERTNHRAFLDFWYYIFLVSLLDAILFAFRELQYMKFT